MQILMTIHQRLDPDAGASGVTIRLAEQYSVAGHDVELISFDDLPARVPSRVRPLVFPTYVAARVRRLVRDHPLDVLDASSGDSAFLRRDHRMLRGTLLVVRSHGSELADDRRFRAEAAAGHFRLSWRHSLYHGGYRLREVARAMRRADVNLVLNRSDRQIAIDEVGVAADRIHVVPNGVPEGLPIADDDRARHAAAPVSRVVQLGSYIPRKGIGYGAAALAALLERRPETRVAFLGTGCPRSRVLADFDPDLHARIHVVERYRNEQLGRLLEPGDVSLSPAMYEGFGVAVLEAMARGVPSVVTATPGPREFCRDGVNALVVPPGDASALHGALERLVAGPALRERLSRAGVATAREYTWPRVAARNLGIYESHLATKGGAPVHTYQGGRS